MPASRLPYAYSLFDPDQPRDASGQWSPTGGASAYATEPRIFAQPHEVELVKGWPGEPIHHHWIDPNTGKASGRLLTGEPLTRDQIPDTLYHVTTNAPAVHSSGVLLGQVDGGGLGGGQANGVSFTSSKDDAQVIQRDLRRAVQIARGDLDVSMLEQFARADEQEAGVPAGTLNDAVTYAKESWDGNAFTVDHDWQEDPTGKYADADRGKTYGHIKPRTPEERERIRRSVLKDTFNAYLQMRGRHDTTHPLLKNPLLVGSQEKLAKLTPDLVQTLTIPSAQIPAKALVTTGSDQFLHEVRAYADVPLPTPKKLYRDKLAFALGDEPGHPFRGNQYTDVAGGSDDRLSPRARLDRLKKLLPATEDPKKTAFMMPDGTRLAFKQDIRKSWHETALGSAMYTVPEVMRLGVVRVRPGIGIEVMKPISNEQAKTVVQDFKSSGAPSIAVDIRNPETIGHGGSGQAVYQVGVNGSVQSRTFDIDRVTPTIIQAYVSAHVLPDPAPAKPKKLYRDKLALLLGDVEGHPFRGNQYTTGGGDTITVAGKTIQVPRVRRDPPAPVVSPVYRPPVDPTSAEHQAWIAGTKVVDAKGDPLTVYHTSSADFSEFTTAHHGQSGFAGLSGVKGVFFSTRKDFGYGPNRYPAQLKVTNPLYIDAKAAKGEPYKAAMAQLTRQHDAVAITWGDGSTEWIVINPKQARIVGPTERALAYRETLAFALGGPGSGNFGHAGRPGEIGGSDAGGLSSPVPVLRNVDSHANRDDLVQRFLDRPTVKPDVPGAEAELRALPLIHGTTVAGALGALESGLRSHADMEPHLKELQADAKDLRDDILAGPLGEALVPGDEEDLSGWNADEIQRLTDLDRSDATALAGKVHELVDLEKVIKGTTYASDQALGLDHFVFMTHGAKHPDYGQVGVVIDNKVLRDAWMSPKDIAAGTAFSRPAVSGPDSSANSEQAYSPARIENYQHELLHGDDYFPVAAAAAGNPTGVEFRSRDQLFEVKAPAVPASAVKGFVVYDDLDEAQRLSDQLARKGLKDKVLYVDSSASGTTTYLHNQLKTMQATGMWDDAAAEEHEGGSGGTFILREVMS